MGSHPGQPGCRLSVPDCAYAVSDQRQTSGIRSETTRRSTQIAFSPRVSPGAVTPVEPVTRLNLDGCEEIIVPGSAGKLRSGVFRVVEALAGK